MDSANIQAVLNQQRQQSEILQLDGTKVGQKLRGKELRNIRGESWKQNQTQSLQKLAQDPDWQKNQLLGAKKRRESYYNNDEKKSLAATKRESNESYKQKRAEKNRKQASDSNYLKNLNAGVARRDADPAYRQALLKSAEEKLLKKGFIVSPAGVHLRQSESAKANNISLGTLQKRIKTNSKEFYYISHEQYIMLTGKAYE